MRKPKNSAELFHYWSAQALPEAKCGNVRYDGPVIYSYAEPIGLLLPNNRVLISNRKFSVTTSSHQSDVWRATYHMRVCHAPFITRYYNSETDLVLMHKSNRNYWERDAEYAVEELKNHPRRKKRIADRLASILQSYHAYREFFNLDWPEMTSEEMTKLVEFRVREREEEAKLRASRMEAERKLREAEEATELLLWRDHATERRSFERTALRLSLDGKEIETTRGACVPVDVAPVLWRYTNLCKHKGEDFYPPSPVAVGNYRLTRIEHDGTLVIGCHTIPYDELVLMAKKLNLITENSNGIESDHIEVDGSVCRAGVEASVGSSGGQTLCA